MHDVKCDFHTSSVAVDLPGEMERVECVFNNYNSDLPLDDGLKIENLTSTLLQHNIIAPNSSIIVSGKEKIHACH